MQKMDPFIQYVKALKSKLPINTPSVDFVLGNESCDLDSTVCSLTLAYFLNKTNEDTTKTILPLLNVLKKEFRFRTENVYVLDNIGIKEDDLIYKDTIDLNEIKNDKNLEITLVDHHVLSKHFDYLKDYVKRIFDHRPLDVKADWKEDVIIERKIVGSCSTLIAEEILKKNPNILTPSMAKILYETIIFDTIGLSQEAGKVRELDINICQELENYLEKKLEPSHLFQELWVVHNDVSKLSPKDLLARDLKIVNNILVPGLPMLVKDFLKYCDVLYCIEEFCHDMQCDHMVLMGLEAAGTTVERDMALYASKNDSKLLQDIIERLKGLKDLKLEEDCSNFENIKYFRHNPKISRKQIIPELLGVLNS